MYLCVVGNSLLILTAWTLFGAKTFGQNGFLKSNNFKCKSFFKTFVLCVITKVNKAWQILKDNHIYLSSPNASTRIAIFLLYYTGESEG